MEEITSTPDTDVQVAKKRGPKPKYTEEERKQIKKERGKEYYMKNREKVLKHKKEWASKNKDKIKKNGAIRTENANKYKLLLSLNKNIESLLSSAFLIDIKQMDMSNGNNTTNSEVKSDDQSDKSCVKQST